MTPKSFGDLSVKPTAASCLLFWLYFTSLKYGTGRCSGINHSACFVIIFAAKLCCIRKGWPCQLNCVSTAMALRIFFLSLHLSISVAHGQKESLFSLTCKIYLMYISNHFVWAAWLYFLFLANKVEIVSPLICIQIGKLWLLLSRLSFCHTLVFQSPPPPFIFSYLLLHCQVC